MKRFLLWISAAALTVSSAFAATDGVMQKAGAVDSPYAGLPGLRQEVAGGKKSILKHKRSRVTPPGAVSSNRIRKAAGSVYLKQKTMYKAAAADAGFIPEVYGSVIYSDNENVAWPSGYQIPLTADAEFALNIEDADATYGGVAVDGKYYTNCSELLWGILEIPYVKVYDIATGELLASWMTNGEEETVDLAYNVVDGKIYGIYAYEAESEDDESSEVVYRLCTVTYPELDDESGMPVVTPVVDLDRGNWNAIAIDNKGLFYGISYTAIINPDTEKEVPTTSTLYKIDPETGKTTRVGLFTGFIPNYLASATFDLATNQLYWSVSPADGSGFICEVNTTTGRATKVIDFAGSEEVVGLYTLNKPVADGAPAAASDLVADYAPGSKKGSFTFKLPTTLFNGNAATGDLKYTVTVNGETIGEGSGKPGDNINIEKTFEESGAVAFYVVVSNEAGESPVVSCRCYVGFAQAAAPQNLVAKEDATGHVTLTWDPVTTDINGVTVPEVTYYICTLGSQGIEEILEYGYASTSYSYQAVPEGEMQEMFQYAVLAECEGGIGGAAVSDLLFVGEPYGDFRETFAGGEISHDFVLKTNVEQSSWSLFTDNSGIEDQNGDNGFIAYTGNNLEASSSLISGKISLKDVTNPVFTFYVYTLIATNGDIQADIVDVAVCEANKEFTSVFNKPVSEIGSTEGWHRVSIDLSAYAGKTIQIQMTGVTKMFPYVLLDNFYVGQRINKDMAAIRVVAPEKANVGEEFAVSVSLLNEGEVEAAAHKLNLYVDDALFQTKDVAPVGIGEAAVVSYSVPMHVLAEAPVVIYAEVVLDGDEFASNNTTAKVSVAPVLSKLPAVTDLEGKAEGKTVTLTWSEPEISTAGGLVDFEDAESFANSYEGWTFIDGDGATVGGIQGVEIPGITSGVSTSSFFVFDASLPQFNKTFAAHSGDKYLAALFNLPAAQCDDWAISPELTGNAQTISFWAKSYSDAYPESFEVMYSTTTTAVSAFKSAGVKVTSVPAEWTEYTAELPAGAKYFAIHYDAYDTFMFMLDDFTFEAKPVDPPTLMGFNVYRDGVKLNATPVEEGYYTETLENEGKYIYAVTAIYDKGESKGSNRAEVQIGTSGIEAATSGVAIAAGDKAIEITGADGMTVTVSAVDGKTIFAGEGKASICIPVAQGVYVVKAGETVAKIIVR